MAVKRYVVHPGQMRSKTDGDMHWIGARDLMRLYGVSPDECFVVDEHRSAASSGWDGRDDLIHLWPSYDGSYIVAIKPD